MPDIEWNKATWDGAYDWKDHGNEWSTPWGGSEALFFATLMPRLAGVLPAEEVLEIAPGHGRCTDILLRFCRLYRGVDLSEQCVAFCRDRFRDRPGAEFFVNNGRSLAAVAGQRFDLVFSFDSLVHADQDAIGEYVPQVIELLKPGGIAFLHHSNLAAYPDVKEWQHRSANVSAELVASLVERHGGRVMIQEMFNGGPAVGYDCFSTFCRHADHPAFERQTVLNPGLMSREGVNAREYFAPYMKLRGC